MAKRTLNAGLKWHQFVPWVVTASFLVLIIGIAVWASQSGKMVDLSARALADLGLNVEAKMSTWGKAWIGWMVTLYTLLGLASLSVAVWRRFLKLTSDSQGQKEHITRRWLTCHSVTIFLWWLVMLLLLLVIVGQALWLATAYAIDKAAMVGATTVERHMNKSRAANLTLALAAIADTPGTCNSTCVDLAAFEIVLGSDTNNTCICQLDRIHRADAIVSDAMSAVSGSTVGAVFMFMASTWMLMGAAADQGATRREISLTKEIGAQAAAEGGLMKSKSFWKRGGKKRKGQGPDGGDDTGEGQELSTIPDEEQGHDAGDRSTAEASASDRSTGKSKAAAKGGKSSKSSKGANKAPPADEESLLGGKAHSDAPQRSHTSIMDMSRNLGKGVNSALSKGMSSAVSSAKTGGVKLFSKAIRLAF